MLRTTALVGRDIGTKSEQNVDLVGHDVLHGLDLRVCASLDRLLWSPWGGDHIWDRMCK
jgi:hypothetical protein